MHFIAVRSSSSGYVWADNWADGSRLLSGQSWEDETTMGSTSEGPTLPDFSQPPVSEVVLGVQFEPLAGLTAAYIGQLWGDFREKFPFTDDRHPLEPAYEIEDEFSARGNASVEIELTSAAPLVRAWFLSESREQLLQVQRDRFIHNWRKMESHSAYPRYASLLHAFKAEFEHFIDFAKKNELGAVRTVQCEVTYVNHLEADQWWQSHREVEKIFQLQLNYSDLPQLEDFRFYQRHILRVADQFVGRLHVSVEPVKRLPDGVPAFTVRLTARGAPLSTGLDGVYSFFALGRESIVRGFTGLTTPAMHEAWGLK